MLARAMAAVLAEAEQLYDDEELTEALARAKSAVQGFGSDKNGAAKALRLQVMALLGLDRHREATDLAKQELDAAHASGDKLQEAAALLSVASTLLDRRASKKGAKEEALKHATAAHALLGPVGERKMQAEALLILSRCCAEKGGSDAKLAGQEALNHASQAREMCIETGNKKLEGHALHHMSQAHVAMGDSEAALEDCDEAMDIFLEMKDKRLEAVELLNIAQIHLKSNSFDRAISDAEDAVELFQALSSPKEVSAIGAIFQAYTMKGDMRRALRTAREAAKRFKKLGNKFSEGEALQMLTSAYVAAGQLDEALASAERALSIFQDLGYQQHEAKLSSVISGLHLRMSRFDRALQHGEDASMLFREAGGNTAEKSDAMFNIVESHMQKKDQFAALQAASEMRMHFQKEGDNCGEAGSLMTMSQVSMQMERYDEALTSATRAQVILGEEGSQYGEASALRVLAEVLSKKGDHKQAVRAAERSRTIFRELSEREDEAHSLYIVGQEAIAVAVAEGARVGEGASSRAATDALSKASKSADSAVKMSREIPNAEGLLGSALCILAQVQMLSGSPDDALAAADEAVVLFRDVGSAISEANALLLSADALRVKQSWKDAGDAAEEALRLFRSLTPVDTKGESLAQEILDHLADIKQQQQKIVDMQRQMASTGMGAMVTAPQEFGEMPAAISSAARPERERGAAIDIAGADVSVIKAKVTEIATRITGAEDGEIEQDTPLMEAGLTSNSALLLRDEISAEMPGVSLPVTLVFDYPSIGAMAELIAEQSQKAIRN